MEQITIPSWLRSVDILVGVLSIALCGLVLLGVVPSNYAIVVMLTVAILTVGLARFARAAAVKAKGTPRRVINSIAGMVGIAASLLIFLNVGFTPPELLVILAFAWMVMGIARVLIGVLEKDVVMWARILQGVVGLATIALTALILLYPSAEFSAILALLIIAVMANGFARAGRGFVGV